MKQQHLAPLNFSIRLARRSIHFNYIFQKQSHVLQQLEFSYRVACKLHNEKKM